jgi:hypothetical protein
MATAKAAAFSVLAVLLGSVVEPGPILHPPEQKSLARNRCHICGNFAVGRHAANAY